MVYKQNANTLDFKKGSGEYSLNYNLTKEQKEAAEFILKEVKSKRNCILNAVTGAGKTEIIYPLIEYCVNNNLRICLAIPRKDVVIELKNRIEKDFKKAFVISVYGGNNEKIYADIVVATTHQLYRYHKYFDVVVIDEVDAFPFYNNDMLDYFLSNSVKGTVVYMSATIPKKLIKTNYNIHYLNKRYHNEKLDIPIVKYLWSNYQIKRYINRYKRGILIVYFPTIKSQLKFSKKLKEKHYVVNSKVKNRDELLKTLHAQKSAIILSTLVLERGITFKNSNVIVVNADHKLFSFENLVQISGRVGRHYLFPHGKILFLVKNKNYQVKKAIKYIRKCNE